MPGQFKLSAYRTVYSWSSWSQVPIYGTKLSFLDFVDMIIVESLKALCSFVIACFCTWWPLLGLFLVQLSFTSPKKSKGKAAPDSPSFYHSPFHKLRWNIALPFHHKYFAVCSLLAIKIYFKPSWFIIGTTQENRPSVGLLGQVAAFSSVVSSNRIWTATCIQLQTNHKKNWAYHHHSVSLVNGIPSESPHAWFIVRFWALWRIP